MDMRVAARGPGSMDVDVLGGMLHAWMDGWLESGRMERREVGG